MLKILKILRRASQNNCLDVVHTVITQQTHENTGTFPEGPLNFLTSGTYREPSRDSQGTNTKFTVCDLLIKLRFRSNSLCITYLFLSFTGKTNIQMF